MADFEKIYKENYDFIFRYLLRLSSNRSLAEELTQETFFRAYMNISRLRNENKVSVWLCQIAKNSYYAYFNEQKKLGQLDEAANVAGETQFESLFEQKELSEKAFQCLHSLDEPYKEVFMLSVFGQLSLKDISRIFNKSESWARVTFYRAKQKLSERMKQK